MWLKKLQIILRTTRKMPETIHLMSTLYETRKRHKIFNINNTEITQHDDILAFLKFITQIFEMKKKCSLYNHPKS